MVRNIIGNIDSREMNLAIKMFQGALLSIALLWLNNLLIWMIYRSDSSVKE